MALLTRAWINQPSTLQPLHKHHGANVLVDLSVIDQTVTVYFTSGDIISAMVPRSVLSPGWNSKNTKIVAVMNDTNCTRDVAVSYLAAEEWDVVNAIISLNGDRVHA